MVRPRPRQEHVGRTPHALRPLRPEASPDAFAQNFRQLEQWANQLPVPRPDTFIPYFVEYKPEDPELTWDVDLVALIQSKFDTDLMPTGTWLVHAIISPTELPVGAVGLQSTLIVNGPNVSTPSADRRSIGYIDGEAVRYLDDLTIDFGAETFEPTYKWYLPAVDGGLMTAKASSFNLVRIDAADDELTIEASARAATLTDPEVDGTLTVDDIPSYFYAWAFRLTDGYTIPTSLENITP